MEKTIEVEIYTALHRIRGQVAAVPQGLYSFINLPTDSHFEVREAQSSALHQLDTVSDVSAKLWLVKNEIVLVVLESVAALGLPSGGRGGYTRPFPYWMKVVVGGYQLRGLYQTGGKFDFAAMLVEGDRNFLQLYDAEVNAILFPRVRGTAPALLFNRRHVQSASLLSREEIEALMQSAGSGGAPA